MQRITLTNLAEQPLQKIEDCWDGSANDARELEDFWVGETQFYLIPEKPPDGYVYVDGRITRKQATRRPENIWPEEWSAMSTKQRRLAKEKWEKKKKDIAQARERRGLVMMLLGNYPETEAWGDPCKNIAAAMPVLPQQPHPHREKSAVRGEEMLSFVARPVKPTELATNPKARAAVEDDWKKLRAINTWLEGAVCEYDDVRAGALKKNVEVHFGRVFALCHEKHSEDPTKSKYKGRVVFQGNQVSDHTATMAVFQDIGSSACLLTASKIVDTVAAAPGNYGEQSDAPQAYTQAELQGIETWIELPRDQWPETWKKFRRPVCMLRLALYGHPMSGVYWELHCNQRLKKKGFGAIPGWEQCFWHADLNCCSLSTSTTVRWPDQKRT